jgi:predicted HD phosphohydrolase
MEAKGFAPGVAGAVSLHVDAKRALVALDEGYMQALSQASIDTLAHQGGPLGKDALEAFLAVPGSDAALRLRRYDDLGKEPGMNVPPLSSHRARIYLHLRGQSAAE